MLSTLLLIEVNNASAQVKKRCVYCEGKGYLPCASCNATGKTKTTHSDTDTDADSGQRKMPLINASSTGSDGFVSYCDCKYCSGAGKVMCPSCLCTGMTVSTEHDPRIDPFQ